MATRHRFLVNGRERTIVVDTIGGRLTVAIDDEPAFEVDLATTGMPGTFSMLIDGHPETAYVARRGAGHEVVVGGRRFQIAPAPAGRQRGALGAKDRAGEVTAPLAGVVTELRVAVGAHIEAGETLLVIEAMKMQNEIQSAHAGTVTSIRCEQGGRVEQGAVVLEYTPDEAPPA